MRHETENKSIVDECNSKCQTCMEGFKKDGIPFNPSMCKYCSNGFKLHEALKQESKNEQSWDKIDWGSSKWRDLYKG